MAKINYKSDFDFILTLRDAQGNDIGFPDFDWEARFWTFSPMHAVAASCRGGKCEGCFNDNDKIHIVVNAPALGCGRLHAEVVTHHENDIYPDGERTVYTPDILDIELVNSKGDAEVTANATLRLPYGELPMIECSISRGFKGVPDKLVLTNAQPYLAAGYVPVLFRKCTTLTRYEVNGDEGWDNEHKKQHGWHSRGGLRGITIDDNNCVGIITARESNLYMFGELPEGWRATDAITFVKPHKYIDPSSDYIRVLVSWGKRVATLWSNDDEEAAVIKKGFRFAIGFVQPFNEKTTERKMLTLKDVVSNLATFSVVHYKDSSEMAPLLNPRNWFFSR